MISSRDFNKTACLFLDYAIYTIVGIACLLYSIFESDVAEIYLTCSWLKFPVFIGEVVLIISFFLSFIRFWIEKEIKRWHLIVAVYMFVVCVIALIGYKQNGAFALRNAALFYYPLFTVFMFNSFRMSIFNKKTNHFLLIVMAILLITKLINAGYFWLMYLLLMGILVNKTFSLLLIQYAFMGILIILADVRCLFREGRAILLGNLGVVLFLLSIYLRHFMVINVKQRILCIISIILLLGFSVYFFADRNGVLSMLTPLKVVENFNLNDQYIQSKLDHFKRKDLTLALYKKNSQSSLLDKLSNDKGSIESDVPEIIKDSAPEQTKQEVKILHKVVKPVGSGFNQIVSNDMQQLENKVVNKEKPLEDSKIIKKAIPVAVENQDIDQKQYRPIDTAYNNILFRLFIWRDMLVEMWQAKAFFGFGFAHPQRSVSLEILGWGISEWERDGWIAVHNSYVHIIYRLGVIGVALILGLIYMFIFLLKRFVKYRSFVGILSMGIISYWLIISNFGVVLELPYHAIPFWSFCGVVLGYARSKRLLA